MAKRRCISVDIIESEDYAELSHSAQSLYIELMFRSDDYGAISNVRIAMMWTETTNSELDELEEKGFLLKVDNVYIITHWNIHNRIPPSKQNESLYQKQLDKLILTDDKVYIYKDK